MRLPVLSLILAPLLAVAAQGAVAQTPQAPMTIPPGLNVFYSPSGQPFRAKGTEAYPAAVWFSRADQDKDGKISHEEFLFDGMAFFMTLDTNKDRIVNSPENTRYETEIAPEITRIDPRITQPKNIKPRTDDPINGNVYNARYIKRIQGASQYGLIDEPQPVRAADANLDFRVTDAEWVAVSDQRFAILDANGDGFLTADELLKTPAQLAAEAMTQEGGRKKKGFFGGN